REDSKVKITSQKYKNVDLYTVSGSGSASTDQMTFAFLDATTVVAGKSTGVQASIDARNGERPNITKNAKLMEGLSQNTTSAIRFALQITPEMTKGLEGAGIPLP